MPVMVWARSSAGRRRFRRRGYIFSEVGVLSIQLSKSRNDVDRLGITLRRKRGAVGGGLYFGNYYIDAFLTACLLGCLTSRSLHEWDWGSAHMKWYAVAWRCDLIQGGASQECLSLIHVCARNTPLILANGDVVRWKRSRWFNHFVEML
ncbi:hypothetical protein L207DRAFT_341603 [Hyaloscypha variabilis F]|uniref:Uncharacterized protein n=1 Tax=Hyaloscypha variabilis (strain UAMH 11265 / GT02V1 / F) TaxID=1149755 RepID=A0A2J6RPY4_HYAVF|nr:hypothetical protein L207DRAFT_341603 [Hyaloscypha variabilis F]